MQLFAKIIELIENPNSLVCVLIDEVESIAYSRGNVTQAEPTDSIRVVNAVLTQLDKIRKYTNVLVLTTSNVTQCIDPAFLDRADIVQHIGPPSVEAIYDIFLQALYELRRVEIINNFSDLTPGNALVESEISDTNVMEVLNLAKLGCGISGRIIRKIPFLAHGMLEIQEQYDLMDFLAAMREAIMKQFGDKKGIEVDTQFLNESQLQCLDIDTNGYGMVQFNGVNGI